jgi:hypothetical protein
MLKFKEFVNEMAVNIGNSSFTPLDNKDVF